MLNITFWQVLVLFIFLSNLLTHFVRDGKEITRGKNRLAKLVVFTIINTALFMQGFYDVFNWPQYTLVIWFGFLFTVGLLQFEYKQNTTGTYDIKNCLFGNLFFFTVLYYGDFFSTISFN